MTSAFIIMGEPGPSEARVRTELATTCADTAAGMFTAMISGDASPTTMADTSTLLTLLESALRGKHDTRVLELTCGLVALFNVKGTENGRVRALSAVRVALDGHGMGGRLAAVLSTCTSTCVRENLGLVVGEPVRMPSPLPPSPPRLGPMLTPPNPPVALQLTRRMAPARQSEYIPPDKRQCIPQCSTTKGINMLEADVYTHATAQLPPGTFECNDDAAFDVMLGGLLWAIAGINDVDERADMEHCVVRSLFRSVDSPARFARSLTRIVLRRDRQRSTGDWTCARACSLEPPPPPVPHTFMIAVSGLANTRIIRSDRPTDRKFVYRGFCSFGLWRPLYAAASLQSLEERARACGATLTTVFDGGGACALNTYIVSLLNAVQSGSACTLLSFVQAGAISGNYLGIALSVLMRRPVGSESSADLLKVLHMLGDVPLHRFFLANSLVADMSTATRHIIHFMGDIGPDFLNAMENDALESKDGLYFVKNLLTVWLPIEHTKKTIPMDTRISAAVLCAVLFGREATGMLMGYDWYTDSLRVSYVQRYTNDIGHLVCALVQLSGFTLEIDAHTRNTTKAVVKAMNARSLQHIIAASLWRPWYCYKPEVDHIPHVICDMINNTPYAIKDAIDIAMYAK